VAWQTDATDFVLTAVTVAEIEFGMQRLPEGRRKQGLVANFEAFAETMPIFPLDDIAARQPWT
jgi:predicted nucleic acid-binding protein